MALNWTMLSPTREPVPLPNEMTITTIPTGAELTLTIPYAGKSETRLKQAGRIWLTDQRLIFASSVPSSTAASSGPPTAIDTLSVPLPSILSTSFSQPIMSSNFLAFEVKPSNEGGLADGTRAEIRFKDRPMFEFVSILEKTRERAIYMKRQQKEDEEADGLPSYNSPTGSRSVASSSRVPDDAPPGYMD